MALPNDLETVGFNLTADHLLEAKVCDEGFNVVVKLGFPALEAVHLSAFFVFDLLFHSACKFDHHEFETLSFVLLRL